VETKGAQPEAGEGRPRRRGLTLFAWLSLGASVVIGVAAGIGGFTFVYAKGGSYMTDNPAACANCHIMQDQYAGWSKSSHHAVAVCNDCHTPPSFVGKYVAKARNGWHHSVAFTSGDFHEPIQITPHNRAITEQRCRSCHQPIVQAIDAHAASTKAEGDDGTISCIRCHNDVGHAP
jgi:cytochrome c nitrite reductase small subunit